MREKLTHLCFEFQVLTICIQNYLLSDNTLLTNDSVNLHTTYVHTKCDVTLVVFTHEVLEYAALGAHGILHTFTTTLSGPSSPITAMGVPLMGFLVSKWYSITSQASQNRGTSSNKTNWFPTPVSPSIASLHEWILLCMPTQQWLCGSHILLLWKIYLLVSLWRNDFKWPRADNVAINTLFSRTMSPSSFCNENIL